MLRIANLAAGNFGVVGTPPPLGPKARALNELCNNVVNGFDAMATDRRGVGTVCAVLEGTSDALSRDAVARQVLGRFGELARDPYGARACRGALVAGGAGRVPSTRAAELLNAAADGFEELAFGGCGVGEGDRGGWERRLAGYGYLCERPLTLAVERAALNARIRKRGGRRPSSSCRAG